MKNIKKSTSWLTLVFCLLVLGVGTDVVGQEQARNFQWKLQKGDQFLLTLIQTSRTTTKVDSRETSIDSSNTMKLDWNVVDVNDGNFVVEQSIRAIKLALGDPAVPAQAVAYDTSVDDSSISKTSKKLLAQVKPLIGLKFLVTMNPAGKILNVELPEETESVLSELPGTLELRKLFSEEGLKDILGPSAMKLPDGKVAEGESWLDEEEVLTAFGKFNRQRKFTFSGTQTIDGRELAIISLKGEMLRVEGQPDSPNGKMTLFEGSGQMTMDQEEGYFRESQVKNEVATERPYREKKILTVAINQIQTTLEKK